MRPFNRLLGVLLALALVAGGLLLLAEGVTAALGRDPLLLPLRSWYATLTATTFADRAVLIAAAALAVTGLVLLVLQLRRWRPRRLALDGGDGWYVHRRAAERGIAHTVAGIAGVGGPRARLGRRWALDVHAVGDGDRRDAVQEAVRRELDRWSAPAGRRVRVRLSPPKRVS